MQHVLHFQAQRLSRPLWANLTKPFGPKRLHGCDGWAGRFEKQGLEFEPNWFESLRPRTRTEPNRTARKRRIFVFSGFFVFVACMNRYLIAPGGEGAAAAPVVQRGALGRPKVHVFDTDGHQIACTCLSCVGWTPPGVTVLPRVVGKAEEVFVFVVERKVKGGSNVMWYCMGCGLSYTSTITRMREHRLGLGTDIKVRRFGQGLGVVIWASQADSSARSGLPLRYPGGEGVAEG